MIDCTLTVRDDYTIARRGIATPRATQLVKRVGDVLVIKVPGHKYWSGLSQPWHYCPATYQVYRIAQDLGDNTFRCLALIEFPVR